MSMMIEGPKPKDQANGAEPVPPDKFTTTHTWVKGSMKGRLALFVDEEIRPATSSASRPWTKD
eukprot:10240802-Prorocentrum_lima.AAC.1